MNSGMDPASGENAPKENYLQERAVLFPCQREAILKTQDVKECTRETIATGISSDLSFKTRPARKFSN